LWYLHRLFLVSSWVAWWFKLDSCITGFFLYWFFGIVVLGGRLCVATRQRTRVAVALRFWAFSALLDCISAFLALRSTICCTQPSSSDSSTCPMWNLTSCSYPSRRPFVCSYAFRSASRSLVLALISSDFSTPPRILLDGSLLYMVHFVDVKCHWRIIVEYRWWYVHQRYPSSSWTLKFRRS
jgi:hypothetical protein